MLKKSTIEKSQTIKAFVFDFDATLMDTEPNWYLAGKRLLADYGIDFTYEMKKKYIGRSFDYMVNDWINIYSLDVNGDELKARKVKYYLEIARGNTFMFPAMKSLFTKLKGLPLPRVIATGSTYTLVDEILGPMGLTQEFDFILGCDSVERGKPAPDIFLKAASMLELKPENILVFEDSAHGVEAAKAAGMMCVAIPYLIDRELSEIFSRADLCIKKGMDGLDPRLVFEWIKERIERG